MSNIQNFLLGCGHFIYFEASGLKKGDVGFMSTQARNPKWSTNCLTFSLSMFSIAPLEMGSLEVYLVDTKGIKKSVFNQTGVTDKDDRSWKQIQIDMKVEKSKDFWV